MRITNVMNELERTFKILQETYKLTQTRFPKILDHEKIKGVYLFTRIVQAVN